MQQILTILLQLNSIEINLILVNFRIDPRKKYEH